MTAHPRHLRGAPAAALVLSSALGCAKGQPDSGFASSGYDASTAAAASSPDGSSTGLAYSNPGSAMLPRGDAGSPAADGGDGGPCIPGTCTAPNGALYCGLIGDGCGDAVDCGMNCPDGGVCGGDGGIPGVCSGTGAPCTGIQCNVATCADGGTTSLSGIVYDPAGLRPIYNALVYVPNASLDPVPSGASCDVCSVMASGSPITTALTDTAGHFSLANVPSGTDVPLAIQVGKWRREVTIPTVTSCVDNALTDPDQTRLPRTQAEGNIPLIALTTGHADAVECLLRRIGIADSEFTNDSGNGRVHLYYGGDLTGPTGDGVGANSLAARARGTAGRSRRRQRSGPTSTR